MHKRELNKNIVIHLRASVLLLIYLISIIPSMVFHHHDNHVVDVHEATTCEKAIFYSNSADKCEHNTHVSDSKPKCELCDDHTASPHFSRVQNFCFLKTTINCGLTTSHVNYQFCLVSIASNKGPPLV